MPASSRWTFSFLLAGILAAPTIPPAAAADLTLDAYLDQVAAANPAVAAARAAVAAARESAADADLLTSPSFFARYTRGEDHSRQLDSFFSGTSRAQSLAEVGLQGRTGFGLSARLAQQTALTSVAGVDPAYLPEPDFYTSQTVLALRQDLWRNAFGRELGATAEAIRARAAADEAAAAYQARQLLVASEVAFWQLALAREAVSVQEDLLERARRLEDWTRGRVRLKLTDPGDLLQAGAGVSLRQLELAAAQDRERSAAAALNRGRGIAGAEVPETPVRSAAPWPLTPTALPESAPARWDVRAAEQLAEAASRQAALGDESLRPELSAALNLAGNGLDAAFAPAFADAWGRRYFAYSAGLELTLPLDWGTRGRRSRGYRAEAEAAARAADRARLDAESEWRELRRRLSETAGRLALAGRLEDLQKQNADYARARLRTGNTVTYQVLQFEQDWGQSRLARLAVEGEYLALLAQAKLFQE